MGEPCTLDPRAFYSTASLVRLLGLKPSSIDKARLGGELRSTTRGGTCLFLGEWVIEWLLAEGDQRRTRRRRQGVTS